MIRFCDNFQTCGQSVINHVEQVPSDDDIRKQGWRVWHGVGLTGKQLDVTLCDVCCSNVTRHRGHQELEGQLDLFEE